MLVIHEGIPAKHPPFPVDLFFQVHYWEVHLRPTWVFDWLEPCTGSTLARFPVWLDGPKAVSPQLATFGGIAFDKTIPQASLQRFLIEVLAFLQKNKIHAVSINCSAACYVTNANKYFQIFENAGFALLYEAYNQHLDLKKDFHSNLHVSARRRLAKCTKAGFYAKILPDTFDKSEIYHFILAARQRKNYPMSLSLASFERLFEQMPMNYQQWGVFENEKLLATCTLVTVRAGKIAYYFLPADHPEYLSWSPSVLLIDALVQYTQQQGFALLDLGISSVAGELNEGLANFKSRLGAIHSRKPCWTYLFG